MKYYIWSIEKYIERFYRRNTEEIKKWAKLLSNILVDAMGAIVDIVTRMTPKSIMVIVALWFNPLSANPTKCSSSIKQLIGNLPTNCLSVFDHFVGLALKGLILTM